MTVPDKIDMAEMEVTPAIGVAQTVFQFGRAESIVGINEYTEYGHKRLCPTEEASAPATQARDVVTEVGVAPLYIMCVAFIMNIPAVTTDEVHRKIALPAVGEVVIRARDFINHLLNGLSVHGVIHSKSDYLPRLAA